MTHCIRSPGTPALPGWHYGNTVVVPSQLQLVFQRDPQLSLSVAVGNSSQTRWLSAENIRYGSQLMI